MAYSILASQWRNGLPLLRQGVLPTSARVLSTSTLLKADNQAVTPEPAPGPFSAILREKTGYTGPWILGLGLTAAALSKEVYVVNAETVAGVSFAVVIYMMMRRLGKPVANYLDGEVEKERQRLYTGFNQEVKEIEDAIENQRRVEPALNTRHELYEIHHENNAMELETKFRSHQSMMRNKVKKILDYHVEMEELQKRFEKEQLVDWLEAEVRKGVVGKEDESVDYCIGQLETLAKAKA